MIMENMSGLQNSGPTLLSLKPLSKWFGVIFIATCLFAPAQPRETADGAAVRAIVQKYVDARESMDAQAIEALFTPEADQLVSTGEWRRGRGEVVRGTLASSRSSAGKRSITEVTVRMLTPDVAIADGRYEIAGVAGAESRKMWTTLIVSRTAQGWRIAAVRNMLPAPTPPAK